MTDDVRHYLAQQEEYRVRDTEPPTGAGLSPARQAFEAWSAGEGSYTELQAFMAGWNGAEAAAKSRVPWWRRLFR